MKKLCFYESRNLDQKGDIIFGLKNPNESISAYQLPLSGFEPLKSRKLFLKMLFMLLFSKAF